MIGFTTKEFELNDFVSVPDSSADPLSAMSGFLKNKSRLTTSGG